MLDTIDQQTVIINQDTRYYIGELKANYKSDKVLHLSSFDFVQLIINNMDRNNLIKAIQLLSEYDLVIVDYIEELIGRKKTQQVINTIISHCISTRFVFTASNEV